MVALVLLGLVWAFASPPGSSNDDEYHLTSIWCAWGDWSGCRSVDGARVPTVQVPERIAQATCMQYYEQSASCVDSLSDRLVPTDRVNSYYNPSGFYTVMRAVASGNVPVSVLLMRLLNVLVAVAMLAWALTLASRRTRRGLVLGWGIGLLPLGIYYIASTNPSSWAITGIGVFWAFLLTSVEGGHTRRVRVTALVGAGVAAALAVAARYDSLAWLAISAVAVLLLAMRPVAMTVRRWWLWGAGAASFIVLLVLTVSFNFERLREGAFSIPAANTATDQPNPLTKLLLELPAFVAAMFGGQPPVWIQGENPTKSPLDGYTPIGLGNNTGDTFFASATGYLLLGAAVALLFVAVAHYRRRNIAAIGFLLLVGPCVIVLMRALYDFEEQTIQPRYLVPMLLLFLGMAMAVDVERGALVTRLQGGLVIAAMTVGGSLAWLVVASRYAVGQRGSFTNFGQVVDWWWAVGPSRLVWFLVAVAATGLWAYATVGSEAPRYGTGPADLEEPSRA
jgi:hypothetical protein